MLSHPKDASQWQALNFEDLEFGNDPRNIVLGASTDGVNPFGSQRSTHSMWPVFVWMYNHPPWMCMKRKYIHMSMLSERAKTTRERHQSVSGAAERGVRHAVENASQYVGRCRERIFPYESRTAHDGARLSRLRISCLEEH